VPPRCDLSYRTVMTNLNVLIERDLQEDKPDQFVYTTTHRVAPDAPVFLDLLDLLSFHILAHSFAPTKNSTLLFSIDSALFAKNTGGWWTLNISYHPAPPLFYRCLVLG